GGREKLLSGDAAHVAVALVTEGSPDGQAVGRVNGLGCAIGTESVVSGNGERRIGQCNKWESEEKDVAGESKLQATSISIEGWGAGVEFGGLVAYASGSAFWARGILLTQIMRSEKSSSGGIVAGWTGPVAYASGSAFCFLARSILVPQIMRSEKSTFGG